MAPITSRNNPRIRQLRAAFAGNSRLSGGLVAIEGEHLLQEALRSGLRLQTIFHTARLGVAGVPPSVEVIEVAEEVFLSVAETRSPQGVAALLEPPVGALDSMLTSAPLLVLAAGLQDPGNLGTLIRSAEAFGATGVLLTPGTVSPWNGKCIRASAGSVFRIPVRPLDEASLAELRAAGVQLLAAVKDGGISAHRANLTAPALLMIGNEGAGLAPEWLARADGKISVPCPGPVESLNAAVAGSLLLYEASRQRTSR